MKLRYPFLHASEWARQQVEVVDERRVLSWIRAGRDLCYTDEPTPLVTVRIATYGTGRTVVDRAIRSALEQTYENLEILVVGGRV